MTREVRFYALSEHRSAAMAALTLIDKLWLGAGPLCLRFFALS